MPEVTEKTKSPAAVAAPAVPSKKKAAGLQFRRLFTKPGVSPYDEIEWELRLAQITDAQGNVIFEQKDVEVPKDWSMTATNIVASKYLHDRRRLSEGKSFRSAYLLMRKARWFSLTPRTKSV